MKLREGAERVSATAPPLLFYDRGRKLVTFGSITMPSFLSDVDIIDRLQWTYTFR